MDVLLLPGNSASNENWAEAVCSHFSKKNIKVTPVHYRHWKKGNDIVDLEYECKHLPVLTCDVVLAKSAGIIVALKAIADGKLTTKRCVFIGTPVYWCQELHIPLGPLLRKSQATMVFIQNEHDPAINVKSLTHFLKDHNIDQNVIALPGDTHKYEDYEVLLNHVLSK